MGLRLRGLNYGIGWPYHRHKSKLKYWNVEEDQPSRREYRGVERGFYFEELLRGACLSFPAPTYFVIHNPTYQTASFKLSDALPLLLLTQI